MQLHLDIGNILKAISSQFIKPQPSNVFSIDPLVSVVSLLAFCYAGGMAYGQFSIARNQREILRQLSEVSATLSDVYDDLNPIYTPSSVESLPDNPDNLNPEVAPSGIEANGDLPFGPIADEPSPENGHSQPRVKIQNDKISAPKSRIESSPSSADDPDVYSSTARPAAQKTAGNRSDRPLKKSGKRSQGSPPRLIRILQLMDPWYPGPAYKSEFPWYTGKPSKANGRPSPL